MASKIKVDQLETADGSGTIALQNQLSGLTTASLPALGAAQMPTGSVLQVVNAYHASEVATTSTSWSDTGLTATITPSSTSSKILVLIHQTAAKQGDGGMRIRFLRGSTVIRTVTEKVAFTGSGDSTYGYIGTVSVGWLDTPSTTSATTYHTEFRAASSGQNVLAQVDNDTSTITLMEIAG